MHSYLRAIGFSKYNSRKQLEKIYREILSTPNRKIITTTNLDTSMIQLEKDFTNSHLDRMGISLVGECDLLGSISIEYYYPYIKGDYTMEYESISIQKQTDKDSYAGVCEDYRLGMTLIFYIINTADYAKSKWFNYSDRNITKVKFSALSTAGTVLLGVSRTKKQLDYERELKKRHDTMLAAARNGDNEAIENLTIDDMDTYTMISNRIKSEDMLSIIDTSFMPCGVECDHYSIIGNILDVKTIKNTITDEIIYNLAVEANEIYMNIAINSLDLQGEPAPGRRFRGEIWLQGTVIM
jgi:hypothetical protein